jgi:hypothetical protein
MDLLYIIRIVLETDNKLTMKLTLCYLHKRLLNFRAGLSCSVCDSALLLSFKAI